MVPNTEEGLISSGLMDVKCIAFTMQELQRIVGSILQKKNKSICKRGKETLHMKYLVMKTDKSTHRLKRPQRTSLLEERYEKITRKAAVRSKDKENKV